MFGIQDVCPATSAEQTIDFAKLCRERELEFVSWILCAMSYSETRRTHKNPRFVENTSMRARYYLSRPPYKIQDNHRFAIQDCGYSFLECCERTIYFVSILSWLCDFRTCVKPPIRSRSHVLGKASSNASKLP